MPRKTTVRQHRFRVDQDLSIAVSALRTIRFVAASEDIRLIADRALRSLETISDTNPSKP